jgi:CPA2 family monovalent cation:H+ antiporter-2
MFVLFIALRYGQPISRWVAHESDEIILLSCFGAVLLVAGIAQRLQVSAAIGAFLVGIAVSGPISEQSHRLFAPLRDLFAAAFFFFFGLDINPSTLPPVLPVAIALGLITAATKIAAGYFASAQTGVDRRGRIRAGMTLIARGEFSMVIAGLGARLEPRLEPLSAAYVIFLVILGPLLTRFAK